MIISTGEEAQLGLDALSSRHRTLGGTLRTEPSARAPGSGLRPDQESGLQTFAQNQSSCFFFLFF